MVINYFTRNKPNLVFTVLPSATKRVRWCFNIELEIGLGGVLAVAVLTAKTLLFI